MRVVETAADRARPRTWHSACDVVALMTPTRTRPLLAVTIALAGLHCGPVDGTLDAPVEEAEGALTAPTWTIESNNCVAGTITYCPSEPALLKSCTLGTSAAYSPDYSYQGTVAFRAPAYLNGQTWEYTYCRGGTKVELSCERNGLGVSTQTLRRCEYQAAVSGVVGRRPDLNDINYTPKQISGLNGSTTPVLYHDNDMVASLVTAIGSVEYTRQGVAVDLKGQEFLSLDPEGFLLAGHASPGASFTQGGVDIQCSGGAISLHPTGYLATFAGCSLTTLRGVFVPLAATPSFDANGFLIPSTARLWGDASFETRRHGVVNCADSSAMSFDADGYLKACTLPAGTTKKFLVNQPNQPKVPSTAANVDVDCKQGFTLDDSGYLASCTLNVARLLKSPPIAGVQQPAINCAGSQPVSLYTSGAAVGYLNRCTPVANITAKSGASPSLNVSCKAAAPAWFGGNGALSSCRLNAAFAGTLPAMGLKLGAAITCAVDTDVGLYPDGLVSRCTPVANTLVRLGDDVPGTAPNERKDMWCKSNADLKLSSTRRVSSCTLAFRTATDFYATGNTDRVCPGNTFVTFTNAAGPRDLFTTVRVAPTAAVPTPPTYDINAAGTPCLLDVAASCSSHAQCDSGICTSGKCAPAPSSASCAEGSDCEPGCIDDSDCASGLCVAGLCS